MQAREYTLCNIKEKDNVETLVTYNVMDFGSIEGFLAYWRSLKVLYIYRSKNVDELKTSISVKLKELISQYGNSYELEIHKDSLDNKYETVTLIWEKGKVGAMFSYPLLVRYPELGFHCGLAIYNEHMFKGIKEMKKGHSLCTDQEKKEYFETFLAGKGKIEIIKYKKWEK
jgi:hypothetical protein